MTYRTYSETYKYEDVNVVIPPTLPENAKQHVFVTHDESTFYANYHQQYACLEKNESFILPKSQDKSITISEFHCPCHGTMRAVIKGKPMTSRVVFYLGASNRGYWTSEHMVAQLRDVLVVFEFLHEGMIAVFLFNQSSNHKAFANDALVASHMNIHTHEVRNDEVKVRNGFYIDSQSVIREQNFYVEREYDYPELLRVQSSKIDKLTKGAKVYEIVNKVLPVNLIT